MNIENEIFKRVKVKFNKLEEYGFRKLNNNYTFEKNFCDNFKAIITIDDKGIVKGKIIDLDSNIEYTNIRTNMSGEFVNKVRDAYETLLINIKNSCFETNYFISNQSNRIAKYIKDKYDDEPEFLWDKFKGYGVFRNSKNGKWFGIIMNIDLSKLDNRNGEVEIINVKLSEDEILSLLEKKGYYRAYHMSKKDWISIVLDDTLTDDEITNLIDKSYNLVI